MLIMKSLSQLSVNLITKPLLDLFVKFYMLNLLSLKGK